MFKPDEMYLSELMTDLEPLTNYKMHFAKYDGQAPLDVFVRDFDEWESWNTWSNGKDEFNRDYIFSLIDFYPEKDTWLFGGIWKVLDKDKSAFKKGGCHPYTIELCDTYKKLIGRLKIRYAHNDRQVRNRMESYFPNLILKEILEETYSIQSFPGYKNFDVSYGILERAIDHPSWKPALCIRGIYLITDTATCKKYVGKASGANGFWQRWHDYLNDGHGGDVDLAKLIKKNGGVQYARDNYKFTILEIVESGLEDELDNRETYWKHVLMTRNTKAGHNKN